jgi:hypothetical protein
MKPKIPTILFHSSSQFSFSEIFLAPINIYRATLERRAENRAGLHVKCPLLLPAFNENWKALTNFSETPESQISQISVQQFSSSYVYTDRQTWQC